MLSDLGMDFSVALRTKPYNFKRFGIIKMMALWFAFFKTFRAGIWSDYFPRLYGIAKNISGFSFLSEPVFSRVKSRKRNAINFFEVFDPLLPAFHSILSIFTRVYPISFSQFISIFVMFLSVVIYPFFSKIRNFSSIILTIISSVLSNVFSIFFSPFFYIKHEVSYA